MNNGTDLTGSGRAWLRRLHVRVMLVFAVLLITSMVVFTLLTIKEESSFIQRAKEKQAQELADRLSISVTGSLLRQDTSTLASILLESTRYVDIQSIQVLDVAGQLLADVTQNVVALPGDYANNPLTPPQQHTISAHVEGGFLITWQPVVLDKLIGWVRISTSLQMMTVIESRYWRNNALFGALILVIAAGLLMIIMRKPVATFERYTDFAERLDKKEGRQVEVSDSSVEMQKMGNALNRTSTTLYDQEQSIKYAMRRLKGLAAFPRWNPNIVLSMNKNAVVQYINPHGTLILKKHGLAMEDIKQLTPDNISELASWCHQENKTVRDVEVTFAGRVFLWTISPVEGQDLLHCYGREITDRIKAEEEARAAQIEKHSAEAASHAKSAFLAHMSHEIRTPLTAIIGFAEALLDNTQGKNERLNSVNIILRSSRHLLHIINEILDLSKIEAEELVVDHESVPLFELLADVASLIELQAQEKGLEFTIHYHFPLPAMIESDPVRLKQILINLCSNAIKFTDRGSVHIHVSCDKSCQMMNFDIRDTGIGMSSDHIQKLFRAFTQADSSISREYGGTGLGLHLSKKLAEKLGGDIAVSSEEGRGSCFSVTVSTGLLDDVEWLDKNPVKRVPETPDIVTLTKRISGNILVAEDNRSNQKLISLYISSLGATPTIVGNGALAVKEALNGDYDLLLMDMQMPVMDGLEATTQLRQNGYNVPIIALTANTMDEDIKKCRQAGSDDFISKPIDRKRFIDVLGHYLKENAVNESIDPLMSELLEQDPSFITLVQAFITELPSIINDLYHYYQSRDWSELALKVHDLKSIGGGYGFPQLSQLAISMEHDIANESYNELSERLRQAEYLLERINAGIEPSRNND